LNQYHSGLTTKLLKIHRKYWHTSGFIQGETSTQGGFMRKLLMVLSLMIVAANIGASETLEDSTETKETVKYWILDTQE